MRTYTQVTQAQRYQIHALLKTGHRFKEIAAVIGGISGIRDTDKLIT